MFLNAATKFDVPLQALPHGTAGELFHTMFDSSFEATLLTRPGGNLLAANPEACTVFGASEAQLLALSRVDGHLNLADTSDPRLAALIAERSARGRARGHVRLRRLDGSRFEAEVSSFLFLDESGLQTSVMTVRDLSPVRDAERAAQDSEQRLSFALDSAEIGEWDRDLRSNVARRSFRHDQCFGYSSPVAEWSHDTFLAHIDIEDRWYVAASFQVAKAGEGDYDVEFRVTWPDGSRHWLCSKGCFYFDDAGRPIRVAGILMDVTARRGSAEALRLSEERLQLALRASSDALWDFDLRTREPYYSPRWLQMIGLPLAPSPRDGELWLRLCHPEDVMRVREAFNSVLLGREDRYEIEFRLMHRDGHAVPVLSRGFVLRAEDGKALRVSGTNTDLTERNNLLEAQQARTIAEAANRAKSDFLSRMSHELRTPLNAVLGFAQLLGSNPAEPLSAGQRRQVKLIEQGGWHLLNLVDDVLDLSCIESGNDRTKQEVVEVASLLRECTGLLQAAADARSIRLDCQPDPDAHSIAGDRGRLRQVLLNLLGNAVKYTLPGGRICLASTRKGSEHVELAVADNGPGLSLAQQAHLYEPFNRLGQESSNTPGTGIGLVICKRLVEGMQGVLSVDTAPGKGCTFAITLPMPTGTLGVPAGGSSPQATAASRVCQPSGRVLYIEDNLANAELMRGFLSRRQLVELDIQHSAVDGLVSAHRDPPDLILLDLRLPDATGLDVLYQLQKSPQTASIPVVVVSASVMPDAVSAATAAGAKAFLTKPLEMLPVLTMLDRWLPALEPPGQSVS